MPVRARLHKPPGSIGGRQVMSDYKGAALMIDVFPKAQALRGDKGYDADWLRNALIERGITPCIPANSNRKVPIPHDRILYRNAATSKTCLESSMTGDASIRATIVVATPSCRPSASQQP